MVGRISRARLAQLDRAIAARQRSHLGGALGQALDALHQTADSVGETPIVWTMVHGDFKPDNMLASDGKLTGIDIDLRYPGPGLLDAAQFLNHLALLLRTPRGIRRLPCADQIGASFCRGYEQDGGLPIGYPQLAWVRLHNAVRLLLKHRDWSRRPVGWITGWSLRQLTVRSTDLLERMDRVQAGCSDAPDRPGSTPPVVMAEPGIAATRIACLEDVLTFLAEDEDTWLSPEADRLLFTALGPRGDRKDRERPRHTARIWNPTDHYKDDTIARGYDRKRFLGLSGRLFNALEKRLIRRAFAGLAPGSVIGDVPCGTGRLAEVLLNSGFSVVGIDISPHMLAAARDRLSRFGERFRDATSDAKALAGTGHRFDAALCARVLMHFPCGSRSNSCAAWPP